MNAPQLLYWWLVTATLMVGRGEATPARVTALVAQVCAAVAPVGGGVDGVGAAGASGAAPR